MATHKLLTALKSSTPALGAWLTLPGAIYARTVAQASPHLSWLVIDCEHGLISLNPGAAETISAIEGSGPNPPSSIIRIPATGISGADTGLGWQIKYALDAGARGIMVPMVGSAARAKEIVAEARFPPVGRRGFGSPYTHGIWNLSAGDYLGSANNSVQVWCQIESQEGMQNLEEIAAVDGIDALFIGPYDLSISHGLPPPSPDPHPEAEKLIQRIKEVAHKAGKRW
ncbi:Phosphoenolpyruvate/pyruvate domain-containing protein [Gloeophyllum trabeum ATCC 11539]|uniref:Phosphoenolpyruvate/pyruvate domain-containing protein n=1 Tax=Gloeophyllum trabeum (strain ATCC 11539 / FP-39264 / Madison 617) TaxID=670483 RepID=S7Q5Z8_GLOTA|nr:Phosphoenolpyruvate/pyruvate domain-containing protein [Gloeophyllum trabeum ATCC 11539]EPQ54888.1 Phosphoenolpyruvate/pyruvate domain-containing protein [Gloeophyllum trabeum ATCC 11539]